VFLPVVTLGPAKNITCLTLFCLFLQTVWATKTLLLCSDSSGLENIYSM